MVRVGRIKAKTVRVGRIVGLVEEGGSKGKAEGKR